MRYFIGYAALFMLAAGCSTTEPVQQEEVPTPSEPPTEKTTIPSWYNAGIHSSSDSLALHGYALASAVDSVTAAELSTQTALRHLRFEIDRTAEEIRKDLTDTPGTEETYNSPAFIIHLRNIISDVPLDEAKIDIEHEISDNKVHYSYTKVSILRTDLLDFFENELDDEAFLQKIEFVSQE